MQIQPRSDPVRLIAVLTSDMVASVAGGLRAIEVGEALAVFVMLQLRQ